MKSAFNRLFILTFCLLANIAFAQTPETTDQGDAVPDFTGTPKKKSQPSNTAKPQPATTTTMPSTSTPPTTAPVISTPSNTTTTPTTAAPSAGNKPKPDVETNNASILPDKDAPLDGIVEQKTILDKQVLPYEPIREADIMWSKRVWRVIDVREKINLPFANQMQGQSFFEILMKGITDTTSGNTPLRAYKTDDDRFSNKFTPEEVSNIGARTDSIEIIDPGTYEKKLKVTRSQVNPSDVKRYRLKEIWYFDKQYSVLKVRVLGIAPMISVNDEAGNFQYERVMYWVRYPDCREYLARQRAFIDGNDSNPMSWEDIFETRRFSSYIFMESNVYNRRLQAYMSGNDVLLEGEKIKSEIFNYEHDLWSY